MKFGITSSKVDEIGLISHAENLGYDYCWVTDSPMIRSDPFAVLAQAARQTQKIRIGTGVAVAGLRLAPVTANAIATINRLAPGRTFLGIGTGNTAMRAMGQRPMGIKAFREYIEVVKTMTRGEEASYTLDGVTHPIQFQNPEFNYVDVEHPIPIHISGFGPRAQALAGEIGDGMITGIPRGGSFSQAMGNVRQGAAKSGRSLDDGFETFALVNILMLEPGQKLTDEAVIQQCGSAIMANVHYLVDWVKETGNPVPDYMLPFWDEYIAFHEKRDAERAHLKMHQSHYSFLDPEEARFITPEMIKTFTIAGQPEEMVEQLRELERQGLNAINFMTPLDQQYRLIEDLARNVMSKM
ncbi:MAG: LLM class flavin-dependent oxidoreductase [Proteobacteria bacterium]|nr:LLM class flavin-dependent oxidoreductase [Pseudomonadota bacterium]